jgi:hypothetical protein
MTSRFMREASVYTGRTRDATPAAPSRLGNEHHRRDRRARLDEKVRRGYRPKCGGRYDSEEDRSPSPEPPGPQASSRAIRRAPFPTRFRAPATITKYSGGNKAGVVACGLPAVLLSQPVLEGNPNANHVRARISNSRTQQLHNMDIITQCSNSIKKGNNSRLHHDVQDIHIVFTIIKVRKRNVDKRGLHRQPTGGLPLTHA